MTARPDISNKLVHFTSGDTERAAFDRLRSIIKEGQVNGSDAKIRQGHVCVCFTEAPLSSLQHGFVNPTTYSTYSPFGVVYDKAWVFSQGGRPVIYQPDTEFSLLPVELQWRHVRYEPIAEPPIDFTWEREWRIRADHVQVAPSRTGIVVPSAEWARCLQEEHDEQQDYLVEAYSQIMEEELAQQYRDRFPWRIYVLR